MNVSASCARAARGDSARHIVSTATLALLVLIFIAPTTAAGQTDATSGTAPPIPVGSRRWNLELSATALLEAWNYNISREELYGVLVAADYAIRDRWSLGVETQWLWVSQPMRNAYLGGTAARGRRWFHATPSLSLFAEIALGVSYADIPVPQRGTRFNLTAQAGAGAVRRVGSNRYLVGALRWFHLSNNGLAGRDRNPDIQALGIYVGVFVTY